MKWTKKQIDDRIEIIINQIHSIESDLKDLDNLAHPLLGVDLTEKQKEKLDEFDF